MEIETDRLEADHLVHIHHLPAVHARERSSAVTDSVPLREKEEGHLSREVSGAVIPVRIRMETDRLERK